MTNELKKKDNFSTKKIGELLIELEKNKKELFTLRYSISTGELKNLSLLRKCKKNIARIKTFIFATMKRNTND